MMIFWGTRTLYRKRGYVADFCPFCNEARPMRLSEVRRAGHIYFVSLTWGKLIGHEIRCEKCRESLPRDGDRYTGAVRKRRTTIEDLVDQTNPQLPEVIAERLDLIERVHAGIASDQERQNVMLDPLINACHAIETRGVNDMDYRTLTCVVIAIVIGVPGFVAGLAMYDQGAAPFIGSTFLAGLIAVSWVSHRRSAWRRYGRYIVRNLRPLEPTLEELQQAWRLLRQHGLEGSKRLKPQWVHDALATQRAAAIHDDRVPLAPVA